MTSALLLVAALATPASASVVVRARGIEFTTTDVNQRAIQLRAEAKLFTPDQLVDGLAAEAALISEARKRKLEADPDCMALLAYGRQRLLATLYTSQVATLPKSTEVEARAAFHLREDTARIVSVAVATREEAAALKSRVEQGGDITLEAARSLDPSGAARRGDSGVLPRIVMDAALAAAVFAAPKGSLVGPIQSGNGWVVAKVVATTIGTEAQFAASRDRIEAFLMSNTAAQAKGHAIEMLKGRARITIDEPFLAAMAKRDVPTPAEADHVTLTIDERSFRYREILPAIRGVDRKGHGGTAMVRNAIDQFVGEALLAAEVRSRGLDRAPATAAALEGTANHLLAEFLGRRILAEVQAKGSAKEQTAAFLKRIEALKQQHDVWVDRPAALAAVSQSK